MSVLASLDNLISPEITPLIEPVTEIREFSILDASSTSPCLKAILFSGLINFDPGLGEMYLNSSQRRKYYFLLSVSISSYRQEHTKTNEK